MAVPAEKQAPRAAMPNIEAGRGRRVASPAVGQELPPAGASRNRPTSRLDQRDLFFQRNRHITLWHDVERIRCAAMHAVEADAGDEVDQRLEAEQLLRLGVKLVAQPFRGKQFRRDLIGRGLARIVELGPFVGIDGVDDSCIDA